MSNWFSIINGNSLEVLDKLPSESIDCCVTSPPYWKLRDYFAKGQLGQEETLQGYISNLISVLMKVHKVLKNSGTLWLVIGDIYARPEHRKYIKPKNLIGIPWRVALALQEQNWYLRCDVIWHKINVLPDGARDRPTRSIEYVFMLTKRQKYYYDYGALQELTGKKGGKPRKFGAKVQNGTGRQDQDRWFVDTGMRNKRSVWSIPVSSYNKGTHRAVFPMKLVEPCIMASCPKNGIILDPFSGTATTGVVTIAKDRNYIGIELNGEDCVASKERLRSIDPLFTDEINNIENTIGMLR